VIERKIETAEFLAHPVRAGLLDLLREHGSVTATDAARVLGHSSGLCSFHLRQLARFGHVEEVPVGGGRAKPWRLAAPVITEPPAAFGELARGLEDESYRRWREQRPQAPAEWRVDEAFSSVLHLTPDELAEVADGIREVLGRYADREHRPLNRPAGAGPVAVLARVFPLLGTGGR
jgi:predicted ArsR family transcriptional regulator